VTNALFWRPHPGHRRPHTEADDRRLGDRSVAYACAELIGESSREPEDIASGADVDAGDEHAVVAGELSFECGTDRVHGAEHRRIFTQRWRLRSPF